MTGQIIDYNNTLISPDNTWILWGICIVCASAAIILEQRYRWAAKVTGALIALFLAVILSSLGVIPRECAVWSTVWDYLVPLCIPMLLFKCNIRCLGRDAGHILVVFLIGSLGTVVGAITGFLILRNYIPDLGKLAGVFTGTYIGGAVNFTDICKTMGLQDDVVSASTVADNFLMAIYFVVLTYIPGLGFFRKKFIHPLQDDIEADAAAYTGDHDGLYVPAYSEGGPISLKDIALTISISIVIVGLSYYIGKGFAEIIPQTNLIYRMAATLLGNIYVWISALSILCASLKPDFFGKINGTNEIGTFIIYIFFFVIGVPASIAQLFNGSAILLLYALIVVAFNMLFSFVVGRILGCSLEEIIIASNANVGGPTTAAAMAVSKGWNRLAGPAVIVGVLGYALGSYLGLVVGSLLGM